MQALGGQRPGAGPWAPRLINGPFLPQHVFLAPDDGPGVVYEFFSPFAHIEGKVEWCRIRSPTHGVFDTFIVLGQSTAVAADVYVNSALGAAFMKDRYPECRTHRVAPGELRIEESQDGRRVTGLMRAEAGPVREATMAIVASPMAVARAVPYGGSGQPVWGSRRFTCWGVDLVVDASATGKLRHESGKVENLQGTPALLTLGSFARIAPLPTVAASAPSSTLGRASSVPVRQ